MDKVIVFKSDFLSVRFSAPDCDINPQWANGDDAIFNHSAVVFIGKLSSEKSNLVVINSVDWLKTVDVSQLSKPLTPQQKEEQARLEAAYDLYCGHNKINSWSAVSIIDFKEKLPKRLSAWLSIVDKTNYRQGK